MVGVANRQWYRMTTSSILEVYSVEENKGVTNLVDKVKNKPIFLPKSTWRFYTYTVIRNGRYIRLGIDSLVEGDIISLMAGDIAPATIRLLRASSLTTQEDHISGSVAPSHKQTFASKSLMPKSQQKNMLFSGSTVLEGKAKGIIVKLAQYEKQAYKIPKIKQSLRKHDFVVQNPGVLRTVKKVTTVFFDDLQQEKEVTQLISQVYHRKHIAVCFFVNDNLMNRLRELLPKELFENDAMEGISIHKLLTESEKAKLIATVNSHNNITMYVHRGKNQSFVPNIAAINMVISPHAIQVAIRRADLIAGQVSVAKFSGILYNKK